MGEKICAKRNESQDESFILMCDVEMETIKKCASIIKNSFDPNLDGRYDIIKMMMDAYNSQTFTPHDNKEILRFQAITNAAGACLGVMHGL